MVTAEMIGVSRVVTTLGSLAPKAINGIRQEVYRQAVALQNTVKETFLDGQVLKVRTGLLRNSITPKVTEQPGIISGLVGTVVKYGRYWELGFERPVGTGARGGPKSIHTALALAKYQQIHGPMRLKHYNARPFLKPALALRAPAIRQGLEDAVRKAVAP